jgi:hypothetical protein
MVGKLREKMMQKSMPGCVAKSGHILHSLLKYRPTMPAIVLLLLLVFLVTISLTAPVHRWGDASTYYMQIQSIAEDFDIQYQSVDINRVIESKFGDLPAGLFLIKSDNGNYFYGKEFSYALFAAPFYKLFGNNGILLFNALMFYLMILIGYLYLKREHKDTIALCVSILFFFLSTAFVYIFWIHAEIYNMFLILVGLFLWTSYIEKNDLRYLILMSFIFGIAAVAKIPIIILFIPLVLFELYKKRIKNVILMSGALLIPILLFYCYFYMNTGVLSFYGGNRFGYVGNYPFLEGYDSIDEAGRPAFSVDKNTIGTLINFNNLKIIPYNLFYYFFGRFTGMIWYYPLAIFALLSTIPNFRNIREHIKLHPEKIPILLGIALYICFFIVIIGYNYLGGEHAVGNRYFYIYPAFLFLIGKIDFKKLIPFLIIALITVTPIVSDPIDNSARPETHTFDFPYKYLPIELSQLDILPFWDHSHKIGCYKIYRLDDNSKYLTDGFLVDTSSDFLIMSSSEIKIFGFVVQSCSNNSSICLEMKNCAKCLPLDKNEVKLLTFSDVSPEYYDKRYFVYELSASSEDKIWFSLVNPKKRDTIQLLWGWYGLENWHGTPTRWMSDDAILMIYSDENRTADLSLQALSFHRPRTLELYVNDRPRIWAEEVPSTGFVVVKVPISLNDGANLVRFHVPEGCERPCDIPELKNKDNRCLSLAFQNVTID